MLRSPATAPSGDRHSGDRKENPASHAVRGSSTSKGRSSTSKGAREAPIRKPGAFPGVGIAAWGILALGCAGAPPRLDHHALVSKSMGGREMKYAVYEPPERSPDEKLPLVVFLHGGGDKVNCFDKAEVGQYLDAAIAEGRIPPAVIAVPQGDLGFWENWADGSRLYRDWVLQEMLPEVQAKYRTKTCPDGCHVMGISMGGHGALRFAFKNPEYFSSVTALSAPILNTEQMLRFKKNFLWGLFVPTNRIWGKGKDPKVVEQDDLYLQWEEQKDLKGLDLRIAWGTEDRKGVVKSNRHFKQHLMEQGIGFSWEVFPGVHEWWAWKPAIEHALAAQLK